MADATARFAITLDAPTGSAEGMAAALERLRVKIQQDTAEISKLQAALKNLQGGTSVNIEAQKNLQNQITAKRAELAVAQEQYVQLGGTFGALPAEAGAAAGGLQDVGAAAGAVGGPVGGLVTRGQQLVQTLGKAGIAGAAIVLVAVLAAVLGAAVAATVALVSFGVKASDAARSAGLLREAATGSAQAGDELGQMISLVGQRVATTREELEGLALDLRRSGLQGRALEAAFSAIATTSAVMGAAAGSALQGIVDRSRQSKRFLLSALDLKGTGLALQDIGTALAKRLGVSVGHAIALIQNGQVKLEDGLASLDDAVKSKFGAIAAKQMLALPVQLAKARENLTKLFSGVKIEPLLVALSSVLSLLGENTVTGRALKAVLESLINPLVSGLAELAPFAKGMFQGLLIGALMFAIAVLKVRNAIREAFGGNARSSLLTLENGLLAGKVAFVLIGGAVAALTILLGILAVAMFLVALPFILAGAVIAGAIYGVVALVGLLADAFTSVVEAVMSLDLGAAASQLVSGFVGALASGAGLIVQAASSLASGALNAIKSTLGISSPSKEAAKLASFTTVGFADQIDDDAPAVQGAMAGAFSLPATAGTSASPGGAPSGPAARSFTWNGDLYIDGQKKARGSLADQIADALETARDMAGAKAGAPA